MPERKKKKSPKSSKPSPSKSKVRASRAPLKKKKKALSTKTTRATALSRKKEGASKDITLPIFDLNGHKSHDTMTLDSLFLGDVNKDVVYQAILMYQAGEREGTA